MRIEILCLLHFCRPGFRTLHISPWSSKDLQVLRICRSKRLDMGLKRVSWVRRYQGQCRALRPLGHQGYRLRSHNKDQPLCSGYRRYTQKAVHTQGGTHKRRSVATAGVLLLKGPQARRYTQKAVHTQGRLWQPQESCYLRRVRRLAPASSEARRLSSEASRR